MLLCRFHTYIYNLIFHSCLQSHSGMQLFMLYKAVQTIIEMAPVDALTANSKNTIAEEKLLKMRIEHQTLVCKTQVMFLVVILISTTFQFNSIKKL